MNNDPWFYYYPNHHYLERRMLTTEEKAAYQDLIDYQHLYGPIPNAEAVLSFCYPIPVQVIQSVLEKKFEKKPDGYRNAHMSKILTERQIFKNGKVFGSLKTNVKKLADENLSKSKAVKFKEFFNEIDKAYLIERFEALEKDTRQLYDLLILECFPNPKQKKIEYKKERPANQADSDRKPGAERDAKRSADRVASGSLINKDRDKDKDLDKGHLGKSGKGGEGENREGGPEEAELSPTFADFLAEYPNQVDMMKAKPIWQSMSQDEREKTMQILPDYKEMIAVNRIYEKFPANFLKDKSWNNDYKKLIKSRTKKGPGPDTKTGPKTEADFNAIAQRIDERFGHVPTRGTKDNPGGKKG